MKWDVKSIERHLFGAGEALFQTGWFMESITTQVLVVFAIRTRRPIFRSRPHVFLAAMNYYEKVAKVMRDVHDFYRVFMAPGMAHCYGGAGPNSFGNGASNGPVIDAEHDLLKALELWVEQGVAPDKIIATKYVNDDPLQGVAFQRPLCPYPQIAKYDGQGNTTDPSSFKCVADKDRRAPGNHEPQAAYR